jgi:hypothetical protein
MNAQVQPTPTATFTIQGLQFDIQQPYTAGHVLTAGEASQLNQVRGENVRNNFAGTVRKAMEEYRKANSLADEAEVPLDQLDKDELDEQLANYDDNYEMGMRNGGGTRRTVDPVQREADRIALEKVKAAVKKKGIAFSSVSADKLKQFVVGTIAKYPEIMEEAKRRVTSAASIALDSLEV